MSGPTVGARQRVTPVRMADQRAPAEVGGPRVSRNQRAKRMETGETISVCGARMGSGVGNRPPGTSGGKWIHHKQ